MYEPFKIISLRAIIIHFVFKMLLSYFDDRTMLNGGAELVFEKLSLALGVKRIYIFDN